MVHLYKKRSILIEITNACPHSCSNCTRFCGHHEKPFFMDFKTFKKAVHSLDGFEGIVGIMGGEPTIHPEFARFTEYIKKVRPLEVAVTSSNRPITNFVNHIRQKNYLNTIVNRDCGPGLWTCMPKSYYKYYELIQDTYMFQELNDHMETSKHTPILVSRKDYNISDKKWILIRDNCWLQKEWSASITPKGAFFCEVAAALDTLFNGSGGWKIEQNWWKREPKEFKDQLHWCEYCGVALNLRSRISNEEIDDVSPLLYDKLRKINSRKLIKGKVVIYNGEVLQPRDKQTVTNEKYMDYKDRLSNGNKNLKITEYGAIIVYNNNSNLEIFRKNIETYLKNFSQILLIVVDASARERVSSLVLGISNISIVYNPSVKISYLIYQNLSKFLHVEWIALFHSDVTLAINATSRFSAVVINPGVLYRYIVDQDEKEGSLAYCEGDSTHCFYLFNRRANILNETICVDDNQTIQNRGFLSKWPFEKRYTIDKSFDSNKTNDLAYNSGLIARTVARPKHMHKYIKVLVKRIKYLPRVFEK